jgi:pentatricopeptide repeat protein
MYIKDSWELFDTMRKEGIEPNIQILNSLCMLYTLALRPEELETKILPLYDKLKIKHDVYTYQNLSKMYLMLRDLESAMGLYDRMKKQEKFKPNQMVLNIAFETALRLKSSDKIYEVLTDYVELQK